MCMLAQGSISSRFVSPRSLKQPDSQNQAYVAHVGTALHTADAREI